MFHLQLTFGDLGGKKRNFILSAKVTEIFFSVTS